MSRSQAWHNLVLKFDMATRVTLSPQVPTEETLLLWLRSVVQLDDDSLFILRSLSNLITASQESTESVPRIKRGPPRARYLGPTVAYYQ